MRVIGRRLASQVQLLERADELAAVNGALSEARSGVGRLVFVTGEAGVGKTSLARVFTAKAGLSQRVLEGACDPLFTPQSLDPFADIASQTNGPLGGLLKGTAGSRDVFEAVRDELAAAKTILVLEDLHWATKRHSTCSGRSADESRRRRASCFVRFADSHGGRGRGRRGDRILEERPESTVLAEASNAMALLSAYRGDAAARLGGVARRFRIVVVLRGARVGGSASPATDAQEGPTD